VNGNLLGINTFILSQSGGNEGIGFAIPSIVVRFVYQEILAHGHVHRREMGIHLQAVTPSIAGGLGLPEEGGLIVGDVLPGGPAESAGLKIGDLVLEVDGAQVDGLPAFMAALYRKAHGDSATLAVRRGSDRVVLKVPVVEQQQQDLDDVAGLANVEGSLVAPLGIHGVDISPKIAGMLPDLRISSGVIVAAKAAGAAVDIGLAPGDVIHSLNGGTIESLDGLRAALGRLKRGDAVVLQIEREERLTFVGFELE
jgi:serine protease Do